MLDENSIDEITYKRWTHTDRSNLEVIVKSSEDFVESLIQMLQKYMKHNFITKMQSSAYKMAKEDLKEGQMLFVTLPKTTVLLFKMKFKVFIGITLW